MSILPLKNVVVCCRYQLPSRKYFGGTATESVYKDVYDIIKHELKDVEYYAATTDMWTALTTEPYMSFTIHYVNNNWELQTRSLQVRLK